MAEKNGKEARIAHETHVAQRRRKVAALRLEGLTQREIERLLPLGKDPIKNPRTGEPYDLATVNRDLKHLREEWREEAVGDIASVKGAHLAELREARRAAWEAGDLCAVLRGLGQEAGLLGLDAPKREQVERLVRQELEAAMAALEAGLEPDEFVKVASIIARLGR